MNFWTHPAVVAIDPASRVEIGRRSTFVVFTTQQPQLLERLELLARAVSSDVPRLAMDVHLENDPAASKLFDEGWMQKLEGFGFASERSGTPWDIVVSPICGPRPNRRRKKTS